MIGRILRALSGRSRPRRPVPSMPSPEKDWKAGDRAECIADDSGCWTNIVDCTRSPGPRRGHVLHVLSVYADGLTVWLHFSAYPGFSYPAGHFRKLRPCSTDFREQLRKRSPTPPAKQPRRLPAPVAIPELVP